MDRDGIVVEDAAERHEETKRGTSGPRGMLNKPRQQRGGQPWREEGSDEYGRWAGVE